ncbi:MAG TPA: DUF2079 domain-containing protein, partial [Balneolales bacterium]|nr:DUF2079 domain-containing protein [Balneolales bacterium]
MIDIGTFDQAVWGTLHGYPFLNTIAFNKAINYLGFHFRPILLIFLPFYVLLPKVEWMILAQSFALSLTAWPIYLTAKRVNTSESAAVLWALVYMINPFVMGVSAWVFRPESLAVPFVALALLSIEKSNFRLLLLSCLFIVLCKEHFGIMVIGFGFLWGLRNGSWKKSILLVSFGTIYSIFILGVIMPSLSPIGKHVMLGKGLGQLSRYSWIGDSLKDVFLALLFHPVHIAGRVFREMGGATYLVFIFLPFLGFPLLAPEFLLPGLADFLANILSAEPMPRSPCAYHNACLVPVLTVAAIYGVDRISRWIKKFSEKELAGMVLFASFIFGAYFSPLPLPGTYNLWAPTHFLSRPDPNLPAIRSAVGESSSVSAQCGVGAYFSQRLKIYKFPNKVGD